MKLRFVVLLISLSVLPGCKQDNFSNRFDKIMSEGALIEADQKELLRDMKRSLAKMESFVLSHRNKYGCSMMDVECTSAAWKKKDAEWSKLMESRQ